MHEPFLAETFALSKKKLNRQAVWITVQAPLM